MIRYLKQEEKPDSRQLWEEVFKEDSSSFLDFYYSEKIKRNRVLVKEEDGRTVAMLHRNPYDVVVKDRVWRADYIAAVSTKRAWRRQGIMAELLERCLTDMYAEQMEFCFLLPVNPLIYQPFGFHYIYDHRPLKLKDQESEPLVLRSCTEASGEYEEAAYFADKELALSYEVFCLRTDAYYRSLAKEVRSDGGDLVFLKNLHGELKGITAYYGNGEDAMREFICLPEISAEAGEPKPRMMARIVCLGQFVKVIRLKQDCSDDGLDLVIRVRDELIKQNDGIFVWTLTRDGSALKRAEDGREQDLQLDLDIRDMTAWLFGYADIPMAGICQKEEAAEEDKGIKDLCAAEYKHMENSDAADNFRAITDSIEVLYGAFLEEIV